MAQRRDGQYVTWGYNSAAPPPATCSATSYNGTGQYTPALAAGAPEVDKSCTSEVIFTVNATTAFVSLDL
jgi:glucoamylase